MAALKPDEIRMVDLATLRAEHSSALQLKEYYDRAEHPQWSREKSERDANYTYLGNLWKEIHRRSH